jgi:hypothetical protein
MAQAGDLAQPLPPAPVHPGAAYRAYPGYPVPMMALPPYEIVAIVRSVGLRPLHRPFREGPTYALRAVDAAGEEVRVVVDARFGRILRVDPVLMPPHAVPLVPPPYGRPPGRIVMLPDGPTGRIAELPPGGPPPAGPGHAPVVPPVAGPAAGGPAYGAPPPNAPRGPAATAPRRSPAQSGPPPLPRPRPKVAANDVNATPKPPSPAATAAPAQPPPPAPPATRAAENPKPADAQAGGTKTADETTGAIGTPPAAPPAAFDE